ncbi:DUF354 domain-containing protein [Halorarum salinum]|uniref:DUF354 domain-containing protein n=1 Tax=Halorarum salinum TaxID=2743089 RepID=A0A7D5LET6_9EURY|nr:DUF354 domain-containing protein [Halobaculum salinum]QLG64329.1 DUF354 domain-containing protein [Halobaculum salinum]
MRALFDVSHPAHVHLFRHAIRELEADGHRVHVTSREKDVTTDLLDAAGIDHTVLSSHRGTLPGLAAEWTVREARTLTTAARFRPDVVVSHLNPPAVHAARLVGSPSIVFADSEPVRVPVHLACPLASVVCTPRSFSKDLGRSHRCYDGFHELAYLHPDRFEPDRGILEASGVDPDARYFVLRFVSWEAHHDVGEGGLSLEAKRELVARLSEHGEVYVSSESELPPEFEPYRLPVPPEAIHSLLHFADLYVGDSQTMATEAGLLATPAVRSNSFVGDGDMTNFRVLDDEYGLVRSVADEERAVEKARSLATDPEADARWRRRLDRFLEEAVDVTGFMLDLIHAAADEGGEVARHVAHEVGEPPAATDDRPRPVVHAADGGADR